jgi:phenylpropionate dioxygenase-like ring-hydroxylating dioxygenase large terminal subunit
MVCRYDQGHAFAFQCSFHGWVYNSSGQLVVLPPGTEQDYANLKKEEWGLLEARVEVFHGSIWANWDQSAPDLVTFLGGAEVYLKDAFLDSEGLEDNEEDGGVEILGGVMKWQLGMNWKVPMPDHDTTHFWVTHRSQAVLGNFRDRVVVRRGGQSDYNIGMDPEQAQAAAGGRGGGRAGQMYSIAFPEGHTTSLFWPNDLEAVPQGGGGGGMYNNAYPAIQKYMEGKAEARRKNLGPKLVNINEGPSRLPQPGLLRARRPCPPPQRPRLDRDVVLLHRR